MLVAPAPPPHTPPPTTTTHRHTHTHCPRPLALTHPCPLHCARTRTRAHTHTYTHTHTHTHAPRNAPQVSGVKLSRRLASTPAVVVAGKWGASAHMEKIMKASVRVTRVAGRTACGVCALRCVRRCRGRP
jgi:hypothetical protein